MRYVELLDSSDVSHAEGQKFIDRIYTLPRFQAYKGHSLQILENQSQVLDEEGALNEEEAEEGGRQIHTGSSFNPHLQKGLIRDIDTNLLFSYLDESAQDKAIQFLRDYRLSDVLILRSKSSNIEYVNGLEGSEEIQLSFLNVLQYAVLRNAEKFAKYLLQEHKVITAAKQSRNVDQRIILLGSDANV